jgi:hypothetical protein
VFLSGRSFSVTLATHPGTVRQGRCVVDVAPGIASVAMPLGEEKNCQNDKERMSTSKDFSHSGGMALGDRGGFAVDSCQRHGAGQLSLKAQAFDVAPCDLRPQGAQAASTRVKTTRNE